MPNRSIRRADGASEVLEPEGEHGLGGLGGEAAASVVGVNDEPELALPMLLASPAQADLAEQRAAVALHDGEAESVTLGLDRRHPGLLPEHAADLLGPPRLPVEIADDVGARVDREHSLEVVLRERPDQQPLGLDRVGRAEHGGTG
jgi:hypothetical protein